MRAVWTGVSGTLSTANPRYQLVSAGPQYAWNALENNTGGSQGRSVPITENIVITKFTMWVGTAPGGGSWTFTIRNNAANTAASMVMSGAATTVSWSGQLACTAGDLICIAAVPSSSPTNAGATYWTIEYTTQGNHYLVVSGNDGPSSGTGTYYYLPFGGNNTAVTTVAATNETIIPTDLTVTRISAITDQTNGSGSYTYYVRNNTTATDSSFSAVVNTSPYQAVSGTGSLTFSPGDSIVIKEVRSGTNWANIRSCMTVTPSFTGEIVQAFNSTAAPSTSATNYNTPLGNGSSAWNATESAVYMRMPASVISKLYIQLATAPGALQGRTFTLRSNITDTPVAVTISGTSTTGNNIASSAVHTDGNLFSISAVPVGTPAATAGVKFGFVQRIAQSSADFFPMF